MRRMVRPHVEIICYPLAEGSPARDVANQPLDRSPLLLRDPFEPHGVMDHDDRHDQRDASRRRRRPVAQTDRNGKTGHARGV